MKFDPGSERLIGNFNTLGGVFTFRNRHFSNGYE